MESSLCGLQTLIFFLYRRFPIEQSILEARSEEFKNMISDSNDTNPKQASGYQTQRE